MRIFRALLFYATEGVKARGLEPAPHDLSADTDSSRISRKSSCLFDASVYLA